MSWRVGTTFPEQGAATTLKKEHWVHLNRKRLFNGRFKLQSSKLGCNLKNGDMRHEMMTKKCCCAVTLPILICEKPRRAPHSPHFKTFECSTATGCVKQSNGPKFKIPNRKVVHPKLERVPLCRLMRVTFPLLLPSSWLGLVVGVLLAR